MGGIVLNFLLCATSNILPSAFVQIIARSYLNDGNTGENYVLGQNNNTLNDGTETLKLIDVLNGGLLPVGVYKLKIRYNSGKDNLWYQDWSDDYFVILPRNQFIEL